MRESAAAAVDLERRVVAYRTQSLPKVISPISNSEIEVALGAPRRSHPERNLGTINKD